MRLSEKTLELSITSQLACRLGIGDAVWFGLTQQQESRLGFDVASRINGILIVFQFKASSVLVHPRRFQRQRRRFRLPHAQLDQLQTLANHFPASVFYDRGAISEQGLDCSVFPSGCGLTSKPIPRAN